MYYIIFIFCTKPNNKATIKHLFIFYNSISLSKTLYPWSRNVTEESLTDLKNMQSVSSSASDLDYKVYFIQIRVSQPLKIFIYSILSYF